MTPPDLTPEQVIAEALDAYPQSFSSSVYNRGRAASVLAALRAAGIPVGWEDVRERLTSEGALIEASVWGSARTVINTAIDYCAEEAR